MHSTTDKWKMDPGIFMKRGIIILLTFRSEKKQLTSNSPPSCTNNLLELEIIFNTFFRIVDLIIIIITFTIKLVLYFKMYKHVSRTLDITTLNESTIRRKLKRVLINLLGFCSFDPQIHYERPPFSIYGQTFSKSYLKHLFMSLLQYLRSYPLVSIFKTCFTSSSSRAAFSFQELCISLKYFRISQLFVDADKLRSVQVHHSQHVPRHVQQGE